MLKPKKLGGIRVRQHNSPLRLSFSAEESEKLRAHQLSAKKPFRDFQVGTRAWVLGAETVTCGLSLKLEMYHPNMSGTNRHLVSITKTEYLKFFEDLGHCPESPAPKISPM